MNARNFFIISIAVIALLGLVASCGQKEESSTPAEMSPGAQTAEVQTVSSKIVDPVCGMQIDPGTDIIAEYKGMTYHFCSTECRDQFMQDPEKYMSPEGHQMEGEMPGGHGN
jgi:YHS domain-containing protein